MARPVSSRLTRSPAWSGGCRARRRRASSGLRN